MPEVISHHTKTLHKISPLFIMKSMLHANLYLKCFSMPVWVKHQNSRYKYSSFPKAKNYLAYAEFTMSSKFHFPNGKYIHGIGDKLVLNWGQIMLSNSKSYQILYRKAISMLAISKVSSLACECEFYRREHNSKRDPIGMNFEGLQMHK